MDTSDNGLISRFGRPCGSAAAAFRPFRPIWRSGSLDLAVSGRFGVPGERDSGRFRPLRGQAGALRLLSQRNRFML